MGAFDGTEAIALAKEPNVRKVYSFEAGPAKKVAGIRQVCGARLARASELTRCAYSQKLAAQPLEIRSKISFRQAAITNASGQIAFHLPSVWPARAPARSAIAARIWH